MISLKKLQKLDLDMFSSNEINENMLYKVVGGAQKTSWKRINKDGDTVASGDDTFCCETKTTIYDDSHTREGEDLCLG